MFVKFISQFLRSPPQFAKARIEPESLASSINPIYTDMVFGDYNPKLIANLTNEHKDVLEYCNNIALSMTNNDWFQVNVELIKLMNLVYEHRKFEFTYLYARLEYTYKTKSLEHDMINFIRKEMRKSNVNFLEFGEYYLDVSANPKKQQTFGREFSRQQYALKNKIALEENSLYPIYDLLYKKQ